MPSKKDSGLGKLLTGGFEVAAGIGLGYFIGSYLDRKTGHSPWGVVVGVLIGCAAGMYLMIREVIKMNKD